MRSKIENYLGLKIIDEVVALPDPDPRIVEELE